MKQLAFSEAIAVANNHEFILEACVVQITKDLRLENDWIQGTPLSVQFIVEKLNLSLEKLLFNSEAIIHQLLYAVDLNEEAIYTQMNSGNHKSLADLLSKSIVERELKKVIFKSVYSGKLKL